MLSFRISDSYINMHHHYWTVLTAGSSEIWRFNSSQDNLLFIVNPSLSHCVTLVRFCLPFTIWPIVAWCVVDVIWLPFFKNANLVWQYSFVFNYTYVFCWTSLFLSVSIGDTETTLHSCSHSENGKIPILLQLFTFSSCHGNFIRPATF